MTANALVARLHEAEQLPKEQWQAALSLAVDAEQSLIGSLLYNPDTYGVVASIIRPHHFHEPVHRHIFDAFEECRTAGRRGSLQEVRQALGPKLVAVNLAEGVSLSDYVVRISQEGPTTFSTVDGARAVRDFWGLRELFSAAMVGPEAMGLPDRVLRETFDKIDAVRMDIAESSAVRRSIGAIGADVLARAERIADGLDYSRGGPLSYQDASDERWLAGWCGCSTRLLRPIIERLIGKGKLSLRAGTLVNARANKELGLVPRHSGF